jgi:hypothetical protein
MIYTFYSFKGGVGRSMALANVAQYLYLQGLNVIMVDWDLEAPGLEEFFFDTPEDLERARAHPGLMDSLLAYKRTHPTIRPRLIMPAREDEIPDPAAAEGSDRGESISAVRKQNAALLKQMLPPLSNALFTVHPPSDGKTPSGSLKLLTAGWRAGPQFQEYAAAVQSFDWAEFYTDFDGEAYFDWLRNALNTSANIVLVDSRTGVTEMGGVSTRQLADVVVCLCAPNRQNLHGLVDMIRSFQRQALIEVRGRRLEVVAVPARIENSEISLLNRFSSEFINRLDQFTPVVFKNARRTFWDLRIPYVPRYAYSETLAVGVEDAAGDLELAYKNLASHLLLLAPEQLGDRSGPELTSQIESLVPREQQRFTRRVFMSFASQDRQIAGQIRHLVLSGTSYEVVVGANSLTVGADSASWVADELGRSHVVLAIITPSALQSRFVLDEMTAARAKGIPIVLVLGVPLHSLDMNNVPTWLRRYHLYDVNLEWESIIKRLGSDERSLKVPKMVPPLPQGFIQRPSEMEQLISLLVSERGEVALVGAGGTGKTVLAAAACHDSRVVEVFYDGILWTKLGSLPNMISAITELYVALTSERPAFLSVDDAAAALREVLSSRRSILVIDDVWSEAALEPFLRGGPQCARLITTRNRDVARRARHVVSVEELSLLDAAEMLASYIPEGTADQRMLLELADRVGRLPLLLQVTGSALRDRLSRGDTVEGALQYVDNALDRRGIFAFDRDGTLSGSLNLTLENLTTEELERCAMLAAVPGDGVIPLAEAQALWGLDAFDTEDFAQKLDALSLVRLDLRNRTIAMHPVIKEFLRASLASMQTIERRVSDLLQKKRSQAQR